MDIETLLNKANGKRRTRTLKLEKVKQLIEDAINNESEYVYEHGGAVVAASYPGAAVTTLVLVARVDSDYYVGIRVSAACSVSPGRAWKCLQPWGKGDMVAKLREWITEADVIKVNGEQL